MSDSETIQSLQARIATLEKNTGKPTIDKAALRKLLVLDPQAFYKEIGLSKEEIDHVDTVAVVKTLGAQAPLQMQMAANAGPQVLAAQATQSTLDTLSRRVDEFIAGQSAKERGAEFKSHTADKSKYPHLSKMLAASPARFDKELAAHGGSVEEFAKAKEADLAALIGQVAPQESTAGANSPSTASVNTAGNQDQSSKVASALPANSVNSVPAPGSASKTKGWNSETFEATKQKILANTPKP